MYDSPDTRASLIVKLRDPADSGAWREFVALYEPLIVRLARRRGLQEADAHDVCQEVLRAVLSAVERYDPARGRFRSWLARITHNLLVNFLSRHRFPFRGSGSTSILELLESQAERDPEATAIFELEYRRRVLEWAAEEIKDEFTPTTWQAFWSTAIEGARPCDIAARLGISVGAVYIARSRALARLKRKVEQFGEGSRELGSGVDDAGSN